LGSSGPPGAIRSCCAAAAEPALGTIRRSGASRRPTPNPPPSKPSPPRRRRHVTMSAAANSVRTASERRWAGCLVPFRQRWSPERRVSTTKGRSLVCKSSSAAARSGASVSVGRRSRRLATSRRRWIGLKRERATYGSSGNQRGSADPRPADPWPSKGRYVGCLPTHGRGLAHRWPSPPLGEECVGRADCLRGGRLRSGRRMRRCGY
jgi:hypothetical protein